MSQEVSDKWVSNTFENLRITPEMEIPFKENSNDLDHVLKTMILDSID